MDYNKNNKLIADYVTDNVYEAKDVNSLKYNAENYPLLHHRLIITPLYFHTKWEWLMPVIEKINSDLYVIIVKYKLSGITVKIKENYNESVIVAQGFNDTLNPIKAYYNAVVEFVKYKNSL